MNQPKKPLDKPPVELPPASPLSEEHNLIRRAMRQARIEEAERVNSVGNLRNAEIARLEMLRDALRPVFDGIPADADIFDHGLVTSERPRLFIDMVSYVEMGRDRRHYRFVQDTRAARILIAEDERIEPITDAVTAYIARRLVERERALATISDPVPLHAPGATINAAVQINEPRRGFGFGAMALVFALGLALGAGGLMGYALMRGNGAASVSQTQQR